MARRRADILLYLGWFITSSLLCNIASLSYPRTTHNTTCAPSLLYFLPSTYNVLFNLFILFLEHSFPQ